MNIDDREVKAKEGMTVLEAARSADIFIPTLCHLKDTQNHLKGQKFFKQRIRGKGDTLTITNYPWDL